MASCETRWLGLGVAVVVMASLGCTPIRNGQGDDGGTDDGGGINPTDPPGVLSLTPTQTSLTVTGADQAVSFRAVSKRHGEVTGKANWVLSDGSVGSAIGGKVTVRGGLMQGGSYKVTASYRNETGTAQLDIKTILPDVVDGTAPADAKDYFTGPEGGGGPQLSYPFDNTMMAPNVLQVELQWSGTGSVFRISAVGPTYQRTFYVGCSGQCRYRMDDKLWSGLSHSALGQTVQFTLSAVSARGGQISTGMPTSVRFSPEDIHGGLYYFSPTIRGIKRVPLGASAPVDFITNGAETGCAGCHAVSRDGKQVAVEFGSGQTRTGSTVVDGAMPNLRNWPLTPSISWNFAWFNPTGDKLITNWSGQLAVRDSKTGQVLQTVTNEQIGSGNGGAMPEWSPDGKWLAFVRIITPGQYDFELNSSGDIVIMPYNDGAFGPAVTMVKGDPRGDVHFWPSWSPDSKWLVFNSQTCGGSCDQYDATQTRLRLVQAVDDMGQPVATPQPIELLSGTHQKFSSNNWPKFAPFLQAGRFVFIVYSAQYGWGFNGGGSPQLFMFGLDLQKAGDPSFQPVWLPFQDRTTGNHSAIWTTDVVCHEDKDCPGEFRCTGGMCTPNIG